MKKDLRAAHHQTARHFRIKNLFRSNRRNIADRRSRYWKDAFQMKLDRASAEKAVRTIADKLKLDLHQAAEGIYNIINENMFGALRLVSVERGHDPRNFALVALGGAGPLHANALSILSGSWPSIIPTMPGVLSAPGFLHSDIRNEFSRTVIRTTDKIDRKEIKAILDDLGAQAHEWPDGVHADL